MYIIEKTYGSDIAITISYEEKVNTSNYELKFTTTDSTGMTTDIFLFQKNADGTDTFVTVAQPYMLSDDNVYPNTRPTDGFGFYRKNDVTLTYVNASDVTANRVIMINKITTLVNDYGEILSNFTSDSENIEYSED